MEHRMIYLDHNATSPLRESAKAAMLMALEDVGNASSVHAAGRTARARIDKARERVAELVGAAPLSVIFTSGGSEANAMAHATNTTALTAAFAWGRQAWRCVGVGANKWSVPRSAEAAGGPPMDCPSDRRATAKKANGIKDSRAKRGSAEGLLPR